MAAEVLKNTTEPPNVAIIFGVTGLVGKELARKLLSKPGQWNKVYGIARKPDPIKPIKNPNFHFISCDLLNPFETHQKLSHLQDPTHLFWVTWATHFPLDTKECCEQNKTMLSNALNAILPSKSNSLKHFSLQTGMKHYVSLINPIDDHTRYSEDFPRVDATAGNYNFYYVLEDLVKERLSGLKVPWSVHRPGLIMGSSNRTLYNFMGSLCVYGAICKYLNLPFVFGGTRKCWENFCLDGSDARLVAEQHIWAATDDEILNTCRSGQAFNVINGSSFTWKEIWPEIGRKFGVEVNEKEMFLSDFWYSKEMADKKGIWKEIVEKEGLIETEIEELGNWDFLDVLFRCPVKMIGSREKVDKLGFRVRYKTLDSILYWIEVMRNDRLVP